MVQRSSTVSCRFLSSRLIPSLLVCAASVALVPAGAQSADSGAVAGIVYDSNNAVIPGATVTATNNSTGAVFTVKSNNQGEYRFSQLRPDSYTITVEMAGFKTDKEVNIVVAVGEIAKVTPRLQAGGVSETVEVSNESPVMHTESSEISSVIDQNMIDNLPINGRRASNFALLTPGVVSNGDGFGLLSFRGISFLLNNSTVDGLDDNQAYFSEQRGRTRAAYNISQTAVQEFQVNTSNFSAEYGRSAGGVINTVTKSGGNQFHGELFFYDRDNDFGASNPYTVLTTLDPSTQTYLTHNYKPKDWRKQWGFGVGGPILRDKLFFFYSYDQSRRNFPGTATASTATAGLFAPATATLPTGNTCSRGAYSPAPVMNADGTYTASYPTGNWGACNLGYALYAAPANSAAAYQQGAALYQQGQGVIASFLGAVPRNSDQVINFPKIDWQINDRNHFVIEYNRLRANSPAGIQTQQTNTYGRASFGNDFVKQDYIIAKLATTLTSRVVNELRFQYGRDFEFGSSQVPTGNELPLSNNQFNRPPDTSIGYDYDAAGFDIGKPPTLERGALPSERRIQGEDIYTWSHGKNTTKAGVDINRVFDFISNLYNENGSYSEDTGPNFMADYFHAVDGLGTSAYTKQYYSFSQGFGTRTGEIATTDYNGFLTNDWRILPRLTLTAGVRYEYEYIPANPYANTTGTSGNVTVAGVTKAVTLVGAIPLTASRPDDRNNIQPRVGFALDVYGTGNTYLRGGYGLYNGRIINANILQVYLNSGGPLGQFNLSTPGGTNCNPALIYPNIFPSGVQGALQMAAQCPGVTTTAAYLDPHLQNPQVHEIDLAIEQRLGHGTVFQVSYLGSLGRELASAIDRNLSGLTATSQTYTVNVPTIAPNTGYTLPIPRGGKASPLANNSTVNLKLYTAGSRPTTGIYQLLDFKSDVNSSYNAVAFQLTKRFSQGYSLMAHYTWAHALDYNPYLATNDGTNQQVDPNDLSGEYGNSALNVQSRFVFSGTYRSTLHAENRYVRAAGTGWSVSVISQAQTGLPFSAGTAKTAPGAIFSGIIGAGGINRLPRRDASGNLLAERNEFNLPNIFVTDLRLGRNFFIENRFGHYRLEFFAEAFNLLNHQNVTRVNTTAYTICTGQLTNYVDPRVSVGTSSCPANSSATMPYLQFNPLFGTNTSANGNSTYTPRQLEGAIRLHF